MKLGLNEGNEKKKGENKRREDKEKSIISINKISFISTNICITAHLIPASSLWIYFQINGNLSIKLFSNVYLFRSQHLIKSR